MVFDKLKSGLQGAISKVRGSGVLDKKTVKEYTKELQKVLLSADVKVDLVFELTQEIEKRGLKEKPPGTLSRKENLIRITYEELVGLLGAGEELEIEEGDKLLLVGVQGSGKTTTVAKIARYYKKRGLKSQVICADTFRPGAYDQLQQLTEEVNVPFYGDRDKEESLEIIQEGLQDLGEDNALTIIDSEGRHKLNEELMEEVNSISQEINPDQTILVLDATIGQQAGEQAKAFKEACDINGVILTKLDGSAKGGGALSACKEVDAPVYFLGVGEHLEDLEKFDPEGFVSRLIGYGDLEGLLEKAQEVEFDEEVAQRIASGKFTLHEFYQQIDQIKNMGSIKKILDFLPFGSQIPEDMMEMQEEKLDNFKIIMDSMTSEEMEEPDLVKSSRIERIAQGSGCNPEEVKELLEHYRKMRKMMKSMGNERQLKRMMKKMGKGGFGV